MTIGVSTTRPTSGPDSGGTPSLLNHGRGRYRFAKLSDGYARSGDEQNAVSYGKRQLGENAR